MIYICSGGFLSMYDGQFPAEHNFFLFPDTDIANPTDMASWAATGGSIVAQPDGLTNANAYWYQFTYEWTDNQGNAFRSAPSVPVLSLLLVAVALVLLLSTFPHSD